MFDPTTAVGVRLDAPDKPPVYARFDLPGSSSDGGAVLLPACDARFGGAGLTARLAACLHDRRDPARVLHTATDLLRQRVFGLCAGYEDCNDAARLVDDPIARLVLGRDPADGRPLASQPTLCRFENALDARSLVRLGHALADSVIERHRRRLRRRRVSRITIDMDPTDDRAYGAQQLIAYSGHYRTWCYLTVPVFISFGGRDLGGEESEQWIVGATLRPGDHYAADSAATVLGRLIPKLRGAFPRARLRVRLDGGFAAPDLFEFLDDHGLDYVVAIGGSPHLRAHAEAAMDAVRERSADSGQSEREYGECLHATESWSDARRVVIKAEVVRLGGRGARDNPRFVVTNLATSARHVYEDVYCRRGEVENRIKELLDGLAIDRTSCTSFLANQGRVLFTCIAYALMQEMRLAARGTTLLGAQVVTLRDRLIKLAVQVRSNTQRVVLHLPDTAPWRQQWCAVARRLGAAPG